MRKKWKDKFARLQLMHEALCHQMRTTLSVQNCFRDKLEKRVEVLEAMSKSCSPTENLIANNGAKINHLIETIEALQAQVDCLENGGHEWITGWKGGEQMFSCRKCPQTKTIDVRPIVAIGDEKALAKAVAKELARQKAKK